MFGFLRRPGKEKQKKGNSRGRKTKTKPGQMIQEPKATVSSQILSDPSYDIIKKISDLQDQLSRHDSRIRGSIDDHHNFMQSQHHEPMKKAAIEIMNKLYTQPAPIREEIVKLIKTDEEIIDIIGDDKMSAGQVAEKIGVTREHISRRISNLTKAGLLTRINDGRYVFYIRTEKQ